MSDQPITNSLERPQCQDGEGKEADVAEEVQAVNDVVVGLLLVDLHVQD